jgi:hypothetical protein
VNNYYDIAFLLLFYGANPNHKFGLSEKSLLIVAIENNLFDMV